MLTKETNVAYYAKAEFPPGTLRDVKCMAIEEKIAIASLLKKF